MKKKKDTTWRVMAIISAAFFSVSGIHRPASVLSSLSCQILILSLFSFPGHSVIPLVHCWWAELRFIPEIPWSSLWYHHSHRFTLEECISVMTSLSSRAASSPKVRCYEHSAFGWSVWKLACSSNSDWILNFKLRKGLLLKDKRCFFTKWTFKQKKQASRLTFQSQSPKP